MSGKDFNEGMKAGSQPFEEKFKLQNEAIDRLGKNLNSRLDDFDNINDAIIDDLSSIEKKRLYDLNTVVDIAELDDAEKEFLLALIYTVSNASNNTTELQKYFVRSVKNYLDIKSSQTEINIASIENIENINSQKAILQTLMEFLFLESSNHDYIEEYDELLSYFSINRRGLKDIREKIDIIYKATGLKGIAENYGYIPEDIREEKVEDNTEGLDQYDSKNILGNTYYNIISGGLVSSQEDWIYYSNIKDGGLLYKTNLNQEEEIKIVDDEAYNINISGDWIYYQIKGSGIYRIKTSGTDRSRVVSIKDIIEKFSSIRDMSINDDNDLRFWVIQEKLLIDFYGCSIISELNPEIDIYDFEEATSIYKEIFHIDENFIYVKNSEYGNGLGGLSKYDFKSKQTTNIDSGQGYDTANSRYVLIGNKIYFDAHFEKRKLGIYVSETWYDLIELDLKTNQSRTIKSDINSYLISNIKNISNEEAYKCDFRGIEKYKLDNPDNIINLHRIPDKISEKDIEKDMHRSLDNLHIVKNRLYFVVKLQDLNNGNEANEKLDYIEI